MVPEVVWNRLVASPGRFVILGYIRGLITYSCHSAADSPRVIECFCEVQEPLSSSMTLSLPHIYFLIQVSVYEGNYSIELDQLQVQPCRDCLEITSSIDFRMHDARHVPKANIEVRVFLQLSLHFNNCFTGPSPTRVPPPRGDELRVRSRIAETHQSGSGDSGFYCIVLPLYPPTVSCTPWTCKHSSRLHPSR